MLKFTRWKWPGINVQVHLCWSSKKPFGQWKRKCEYVLQRMLTWSWWLRWLQHYHLSQCYSECGPQTSHCLLLPVLLPGCQWTSSQSTSCSRAKEAKCSWWRKQGIILRTSLNTSSLGAPALWVALNFKGSSVSIGNSSCAKYSKCIIRFMSSHSVLRASVVKCINKGAWTKLPQFPCLMGDNNMKLIKGFSWWIMQVKFMSYILAHGVSLEIGSEY